MQNLLSMMLLSTDGGINKIMLLIFIIPLITNIYSTISTKILSWIFKIIWGKKYTFIVPKYSQYGSINNFYGYVIDFITKRKNQFEMGINIIMPYIGSGISFKKYNKNFIRNTNRERNIDVLSGKFKSKGKQFYYKICNSSTNDKEGKYIIVNSDMPVDNKNLKITGYNLENITALRDEIIRGYYDDIVMESCGKARKYIWGEIDFPQWIDVKYKCKRTEENSFYPQEKYIFVMNKCRSFYENKGKYRRYGLGYKLSFLFYGPPGTGKTSFAELISRIFKKDIYVLNGEFFGINKILLKNHFHKIRPNSIIVINDFDLIMSQCKRKVDDDNISDKNEKKNNFIKSILDLLDNDTILHGCILIISTNKRPEDFDPAIVRSGRIDYKIELSACDEYQLRNMCTFYGLDYSEHRHLVNEITPAEFIYKYVSI